MTRDEILQLQPGEELDRLVAETFEKQPANMGINYWEEEWGESDYDVPSISSPEGYWVLYDEDTIWSAAPFSTDATAALRLWDAIVARELWVMMYRDKGLAEITIGDKYGKYSGAEAETWMHGLVVAWLLWCEEHKA